MPCVVAANREHDFLNVTPLHTCLLLLCWCGLLTSGVVVMQVALDRTNLVREARKTGFYTSLFDIKVRRHHKTHPSDLQLT